MISRMTAKLGALWRNERATTIVEFGFVAPPLILILVGGLDFAHRSYVHSVMQGALNDAARRASVEDPTVGGEGTIEERVQALVEEQVHPISPSGTVVVTQSNYFDFSGIGNPEKIVKDVDKDGIYDEDDGDCFSDLNENASFDMDTGREGRGGANDVVFYEATMTMDALLPLRSFVGGSDVYTLRAETAIRNQPWETQKTPPVVCGTVA